MQRIDELDEKSRGFYERAKLKLSLSLFFAAVSLLELGIASQSGGQASAHSNFAEISTIDADTKDAETNLVSSFGFACFIHLFVFL